MVPAKANSPCRSSAPGRPRVAARFLRSEATSPSSNPTRRRRAEPRSCRTSDRRTAAARTRPDRLEWSNPLPLEFGEGSTWRGNTPPRSPTDTSSAAARCHTAAALASAETRIRPPATVGPAVQRAAPGWGSTTSRCWAPPAQCPQTSSMKCPRAQAMMPTLMQDRRSSPAAPMAQRSGTEPLATVEASRTPVPTPETPPPPARSARPGRTPSRPCHAWFRTIACSRLPWHAAARDRHAGK